MDADQIARLQAADAVQQADQTARLQKIDAVQNRSAGDTTLGYGQAALGGVNDGIGRTVGLPVDLYNLVGDTVGGRLPAWLADKAGASGVADFIRQHGYHDIYPGSGQSVVDLEKKAGIGYDAKTPGEQAVKDVVSGATTAGLTAGVTGGLSGLVAANAAPDAGIIARTVANAAPKAGNVSNMANQAIAGAGGVVGGDLARKANTATGGYLPGPMADLIGTIFGAGATSGAANRTALYEPSVKKADLDTAGVTPRFASDVTDQTNPLTWFTDKFLPNRFGASDISKNSAKSTQSELSDYGKRVVGDAPTVQTQGDQLQSQAQRAIDKLKTNADQAWDDVRKEIPSATPVSTTATTKAIGDLVNRANDPDIKAILATPTFTRFAALLNKPTLSFGDMTLLKTEVGQSMQGAEGSELGLLKQIYASVNNDMQSAAAQTPAGLQAWTLANEASQKLHDDGAQLLKDLTDKTPEQIPGWMTQQTKLGATRVQQVGDALYGPNAGAQMGPLGQNLLNNAARDPAGNFSNQNLLNFWNSRSPEAQTALTADPAIEDGMNRLARLQAQTAQSNGIASGKPVTASGDPATWMSGLGGAGLLLADKAMDGVINHPAVAAGALISEPALAGGAALASQRNGLVGHMNSDVTGGMITPQQKLMGAFGGSFPDFYSQPPQPNYQVPGHGDKIQDWFGQTDRPSAVNYVRSKLGDDVASKLDPNNDAAWKAGVFNLFSDPGYRNALVGAAAQD